MSDLIALSRTIPIAALEHRLHLQPLVEARAASAPPHPSWVALFLRGFALVARHRPQLRQGYFGFPWPRLYEHPCNVAAITVERDYGGEPCVFFDMLPHPETMSVREIHQHLRGLKKAPLEDSRTFRLLISGSRFPARAAPASAAPLRSTAARACASGP
jgi:hypothetical protein